MRRKNWVIPGFLVLAVLLLFAFPGVVLAEDSGTVPAGGGTPVSVQTEQSVQEPAADSGSQQGTDNVPAVNDADSSPSSTERTDPGTVSGNVQKEQTADSSAPEKPVSADPVDSSKAGEAGQGSSADTAAGEEKTPAETENQAPSDTAAGEEKPEAEPDDKAIPAEPVKPDVKPAEPEKQGPADTAKPEDNTTADPEKQSPSDTSTGEENTAEPDNGIIIPDGSQNCIDPAPVIVIPKETLGEQDTPAVTVKPWGLSGYVVQPGDTVKKISEKTGVSADKIKEANGLNVAENEAALPLTSSVSTDVPSSQVNNKAPGPSITYIVRKGESLWLIGRNLGVPYEEIMAANNLTGHLIYPDQKLVIPGIKLEGNMFRYRIKDGDTFYFIARALGLNFDEVMSLNGYDDIWIYPGQELVIPDMAKVDLYKVQEGETLSGIAEKFSVIKSRIYGHGVSDGKLVEGQILVIPQDAAAPEAVNMQVKADAGVRLENASDLDLLATAIYAEARGEVYEGKVAVGAVILNRLKDPAFPKTIRDIIFQPRAFTAVDDGQINLTPDQEAYRAAREALNGTDPSLGAVYYWNPEVATSEWIWSRPIIKQIGNHVFAR